jgi:hypothetical protein
MDHDYYVPCFSRLVPQVLYGFQSARGQADIRLPDITSIRLNKTQQRSRIKEYRVVDLCVAKAVVIGVLTEACKAILSDVLIDDY